MFSDDIGSFSIPPELSLVERLMSTDPTEEAGVRLAACDGGFTQALDTVGAGEKSHAERA